MKIAVLINNYNYENFVIECLASLLNQSRKPDQVVLVDDGSTDGSIEAITRFMAENPSMKVKLVKKENGGQLSAFNAGFMALDDDIGLVCFLDSDDKYHSDYLNNLERTAASFRSTEVFFSSYNFLYPSGDTKPMIMGDEELPPQFLQTVFANRFNGVPTSMVSFRKSALSEILPHPDFKEWKIRADDVLVYLASAKIMTRRYLPEPLVYYRIHGNNLFQGKKRNPNAESRRLLALAKIMAPYREMFHKLTYVEMRKLLDMEFSQDKSILKSTYRFLSILTVLKLPFFRIPGFIYAFLKAKLRGLFK